MDCIVQNERNEQCSFKIANDYIQLVQWGEDIGSAIEIIHVLYSSSAEDSVDNDDDIISSSIVVRSLFICSSYKRSHCFF